MYGGKRISVMMPCFNEQDGIRSIMKDMPKFVDEVIVVDNNSTDHTTQVARDLGAAVVFEPKKGYGAAHKAGLREAKGDIIVAMDGDGTYPRNFIPVLLDIMLEENIDFISCDRTGHKDRSSSRLRLFGNWVLSTTIGVLFFLKLRDSQSGMWILKRELLDKIKLTSDGMAFSEEIKIEAFGKKGITAKELPIYYKVRVGKSKLHIWRDGFANMIFLLKKRVATRADYEKRT